MKIIELLSVANQNKTTEKNNINEKSSDHLQAEYQHHIQHKKQQNGSKQHPDTEPELQRQRQQQRQQRNQLPLRNFYQPLTPLTEEFRVQ